MIESELKDGERLFSLYCDNCGRLLRNMYYLGGEWNFRVETLDFAKKEGWLGILNPTTFDKSFYFCCENCYKNWKTNANTLK